MSGTSDNSGKLPTTDNVGGVISRVADVFTLFLSTWRFAAFALSLIILFAILMISVLLLPVSGSALAEFAADFKTWCFGYDPSTGKMDYSYLISFLAVTITLCGTILMIWGGALRETFKTAPLRLAPYVGVALALVLSAGAGFAAMYKPPVEQEPPFPAKKLRTAYAPATFTLLNQKREAVTLDKFKGRVVLMTAVYSTCGTACPMMLAQIKRVLAALTLLEKKSLNVLAITLDPDRDTPEQLARLAKAHKVSAPFFQLLTGKPVVVNQTLDDFDFSRWRDPKSGVIDHPTVFLLIDRNGKLAYRFSLGKTQESWLTQALKLLIKEKPTK